jgi:cyclohexadieny/prephenate dehydrogenase / 3-phosphoshikimate 1-carboxyvinyltransferase
MSINNLIVLGSGLIGGSVAKSARESGVANKVTVFNRQKETSDRAVELGIADIAKEYSQLAEVCAGLGQGDLVLVAVPIYTYSSIFDQLGDLLPSGVILTDVGSTKAEVVNAAREHWQGDLSCFVPGHPIAGSEKSGIEASDGQLFQKRRTIITPLEESSEVAISIVRGFWESLGAEVDIMDVVHHDEILAATSHLPHLLAYSLVDSLVTLDQSTEVFRYAAGGFRDFTRIAESDPVMWRDIFVANRDALLKQLENFEEHLKELHQAITDGDTQTIESILERAQAARKVFSETSPKT